MARSIYSVVELRVGDPQAVRIYINEKNWKTHKTTWFAEALHVQWAQVVFMVQPRAELDLDHVELQEILPGEQ